MTSINDPGLVAELTKLYLKYETALCQNDLETMDSLFWHSPQVVRFGVGENLHGIDAIRSFRQNRLTVGLERSISNLQIVTFDQNTAAVTLEFCRVVNGVDRQGRQSQMWYRFPEGWKIVSAHVSLLPN
jgi:hypothetical protein